MSTIQPTTSKSNRRRQKKRRKEKRYDLLIRIGGQAFRYQADHVDAEKLLVKLQERCEEAGVPVEFHFPDYLGLSDEVRFNILFTLVKRTLRYSIHFAEGKTFKDVFEATLHASSHAKNTARRGRALQAALEAAALVHPGALPVACSRIADHFRKLGVTGLLPQSLAKQAKDLIKSFRDSASDGPTPHAAAENFIESLIAQATNSSNADEEEEAVPPAYILAYHREDFYTWDAPKWCQLTDDQLRARLTRWLQLDDRFRDKVTTSFVRDVVTNLKGLTNVQSADVSMPLLLPDDERDVCEPSPYLLFQNGMIDVTKAARSDGEVEVFEVTPTNFTTVALPYDFDPEAECPLWLETIEQIFRRRGASRRQRRRDRRIAVLQEFMGYTLLPRDTTFEKCLVMVGDGGNGKSTIFGTWQQLLGEENVSHVPLDGFAGEFRLDQMINKFANIAADMNRMDRMEEGLLKMLVSGDSMQVNRKNKSPITMTPTAKLIFGTNILPPINDRSNGVFRRLIPMPLFEVFEADRDRHRQKRLRDELPGIFNWALKGARRLVRQDGFTPCSVCEKCRGEHRLASDPVRQFIRDECRLRQGAEIVRKDLFTTYKRWCEENGRKWLSSSEFGKQIAALGVGSGRESTGTRRWTYTGIVVRAIAPS